MTETLPSTTQSLQNWLSAWGENWQAAVCEHCHASYLIPCAEAPICPHCHRQALVNVSESSLPGWSPELMAPFEAGDAQINTAVQQFAAQVPFAPAGLTADALRGHLQKIYLPMWLVDASLLAIWQAEAGFDYQVISHQEHYLGDQRQWQTKEVREQRIRWEKRVGRLRRSYQNVPAPALADAHRLEQQVGTFSFGESRRYDPQTLQNVLIRLPDQTPQDAWSEASAAFEQTASAECQQACAAQHLRQFRWKAQFAHQNWTLLLLPIYSATYQDDAGENHTLLLHGQTGKISGTRRASMRRAGVASLQILTAGLLLLVLGILLEILFSGAIGKAIATYLLIFGSAGILGAVVPFLIAWDYNHKQRMEENSV